MSQQLYTQIVTLIIMIFVMTVFVASVITGKDLNITQLLTLILPALMQVAQMFTNTLIAKTQVQTAAAKEVATIQSNGKAASTSH
jgi:hypothetical protein